jgi:hypothetical protein
MAAGSVPLLEERPVEVDLNVELAGSELVELLLEDRKHFGVPVGFDGRRGNPELDGISGKGRGGTRCKSEGCGTTHEQTA